MSVLAQKARCMRGLSPQSIFIRPSRCLFGNANFVGNWRHSRGFAGAKISNDAGARTGLACFEPSQFSITWSNRLARPIAAFDPTALCALQPWHRRAGRIQAGRHLRATRNRSDEQIPADCEAQAELCFANIAAILVEDGMTMANVVRLNAYVTGREHMPGYMRARDRQFSATPPASTLVIVSGFTRPEFVVEIEAIAAAPG